VLAVRLRGDELAVAYRDFDRSAWTDAQVRSVAAAVAGPAGTAAADRAQR
jgi:hypothetical protein